jgi:hypothetical protein
MSRSIFTYNITINKKDYSFSGPFAAYANICTIGVLSGTVVGAAAGGLVGFAVCAGSPIIAGRFLYRYGGVIMRRVMGQL